eukprot:8613222-Pyramimonas_sp.AAC.1
MRGADNSTKDTIWNSTVAPVMRNIMRGSEKRVGDKYEHDQSADERTMLNDNARACISPKFLDAVQRRMPLEIEIKDRRWGLLMVYKSCFTGTLAVQWLKKNKYVEDDLDAMIVCNFLLHSGFFQHVAEEDHHGAALMDVILSGGNGPTDQFRNSESAFYRFGKGRFDCTDCLQQPSAGPPEPEEQDPCGINLLHDTELAKVLQNDIKFPKTDDPRGD